MPSNPPYDDDWSGVSRNLETGEERFPAMPARPKVEEQDGEQEVWTCDTCMTCDPKHCKCDTKAKSVDSRNKYTRLIKSGTLTSRVSSLAGAEDGIVSGSRNGGRV